MVPVGVVKLGVALGALLELLERRQVLRADAPVELQVVGLGLSVVEGVLFDELGHVTSSLLLAVELGELPVAVLAAVLVEEEQLVVATAPAAASVS